jgi:tetratricopeptide (TPR) repeat protein
VALPYYQEALQIQRQAGDRHGEAITLANLGSVCWGQGDYSGARDNWQEALALYRQVGDQRGEGIVVNNLGLLSRNLGDYDGARALFEGALPIRRQIGDQRGTSLTMANLGLLSHLRGHDEEARHYCQQALRIAREIHHPSSEGMALTRLGHALAGLGDRDGARHAYDGALAIRRELGEHNLAMECLEGLASLSLEEGDLETAGSHVDEILAHLETGSLEGTDHPFLIYLTCYRVLLARGDTRATKLLRVSYQLLEEQAARIGDETMRHSFLVNVACHRELLRAMERGGPHSG